MWDGLLTLLLLCLIMGTASYLAGALPLTLTLSSKHMRLISALGTGVLVGTSLIVIIPEGIETLYSASGSSHAHFTRSVGLVQARDMPVSPMVWPSYTSLVIRAEDSSGDPIPDFRTGPDDGFHEHKDMDKPVTDATPNNEADPVDPDTHDETTNARDPHVWVGLALISGFVLMYLIDTIPRQASNSSQPRRFSISLTSLSLYNREAASDANATDSASTREEFEDGPDQQSRNRARPTSTTIGLVIHAVADGIALGASSATTSRLTFIIFIALMIHKAPAAFGLTSVLTKQGLSKRAARAHLVIFSLAAPAGALLTWSAAHLLGYSTSSNAGEDSSAEFATGVLLLFSAGTFLYVAMHTMQETSGAAHSHAGENGHAAGYDQNIYGQTTRPGETKGSQLTETLVTVGGMLLPLLTQFGHVH